MRLERETKRSAAEKGARVSAEHRRRPGYLAGHPATSDRLYADDEEEFLAAMEDFKKSHRRPFPTWSDALAVLKSLGYSRRPA